MLAAACAVFAADASAGTYSVYSCAGPNSEVLGNEAWLPQVSNPAHSASFSLSTSCGDYSAVAGVGVTMTPGENAGLQFDAPAGTTISGYVVKRSAGITFPTSGTRPAYSSGLRSTVNSVNSYFGECEAKKVDCSIPMGGTQSQNLNASSLQLGVECAETSGSCASSSFTTLRARLYDSRVDIKDLNAPVLSVTGGSLPGASGLVGTHTLAIAASDLGGGIRSLSMSVDGVVKSSTNTGGSCAEPYTKATPCLLSTTANYSVNLGSYTSGAHSVVVSATDAAGNVGTLAPVSFKVGGVGANGTPAVEFPSLKTSKAKISAKSSKKVAIGGVLTTSSGKAIGGATLEVFKTSVLSPAAGLIPIGSTKTASNGKFSFKVKPSGVLKITFLFRPATGAQSTATASTTLTQKLALTARGSKRALGRGGKLTIAGRLSGAGSAASGVPVDIQVKNGKRWSTIESVTSGKGGAYKWQHRFTRVTRPTLFTFRAIVRSKPGWPWPSRSSSPVQVLVNP